MNLLPSRSPSPAPTPGSPPRSQRRKAGPGLRIHPTPHESLVGLSVLCGISLSFLAVGMAGALPGRDPFEIVLSAPVDARSEELPVIETTMADLQAMTMTDEPEGLTNEDTPPAPAPEPEPVAEEVPEPIEALDASDVLAVPAAARIETVNPFENPPPPAVKPKAKARPSPPAPRSDRPSAPAAAPRPEGKPTGGAGTAQPARSGGKGRFPAPPYPSFARSRKLQGSVTLNIRVAADGTVQSASVMSGTGSTELDEYAASWVKRKWRFPSGAAANHRLPIVFRLR